MFFLNICHAGIKVRCTENLITLPNNPVALKSSDIQRSTQQQTTSAFLVLHSHFKIFSRFVHYNRNVFVLFVLFYFPAAAFYILQVMGKSIQKVKF